jgi:hypothetical protein
MSNTLITLIALGVSAGAILADDTLHMGAPTLDRPTLTTLGIQLPITGDDDMNASVSVRYRQAGTNNWRAAMPLFRVHPESSAGWPSRPQFAGTIFDLRPGTTYEIELHGLDSDGSVDQTYSLTGTTRTVPADPPSPRNIAVQDVASLKAALNGAKPGDIITLADGVYNVGSLFFFGSGTPNNPIVIRGASQDGTILDGANCDSCNIVEIYGSWVHLERMTLRNAQRAVRFQTNGAQGNVLRRVHIKNVQMALGARENQLDFYVCDNIAEGRLSWPNTYRDDNGAHASDDGFAVTGFGHVVCHNRISGFGDAMKTTQDGARAIDFYNNEILWTYDNGVELDGSEGNTRVFRNRFTNTYGTLSVQPVHGGPSYLVRNVIVNVADEQMKFHALGGNPPQEPNGVVVLHNTFVSPNFALNMNTPNASHHSVIENNLFITTASASRIINWSGPMGDGDVFDYNGYWPDAQFTFNVAPLAFQNNFPFWPNFASMQAGGIEKHGLELTGQIFANGLTAPASYFSFLAPQDVSLAAGSNAIDHGLLLPNINDSFTGAGPDLGALETGCPLPLYGPRPEGMDESNEPFGCDAVNLPTPVVTVSVTPPSVSLGPSQTQQFSAAVGGTGNTAVNWSISPSIGGISSSGLYTAPSSISSSQQVTVKATSQADPTKSAGALVTLNPPAPVPTPPTGIITVTITPAAARLNAGQTQQFSANVSGTSDTRVSWSISPSLGSITASGFYTAPASIASLGLVSITARSVANPNFSSTTVAFLIPGGAAPTPTVSISVSPTAVTLARGQSQQFSASVGGTGNTAVTWSINPNAGTILANGVYTAPASLIGAPPSITVTATSAADPSKSASAIVTLATASAGPVSVSISPGAVFLHSGQTQQFTANTAVNWILRPSRGSVSANGLYTAPSNMNSLELVTITAVSVADPNVSSSTAIFLQP